MITIVNDTIAELGVNPINHFLVISISKSAIFSTMLSKALGQRIFPHN